MPKKYEDANKKYLDWLTKYYLSGEDISYKHLEKNHYHILKNIEQRFSYYGALQLVKIRLENSGKKLEAKLLDVDFLKYRENKIKINEEDIIFFINEKTFRPEYHLMDFLGKNGSKTLKDKVNNSVSVLELILDKYKVIPVEFIKKDDNFPREHENIVLKEIQTLKEFEQKTAFPDISINYKVLAEKLCHISEFKSKFKSFNQKFSKKRIEKMIDNYILLDKVLSIKSQASYLLFRNYKPMISKLIWRKGGDSDLLGTRGRAVGTFMDIAKDAFLRAVNDFDPDKGHKFFTLAYKLVSQRIKSYHENYKIRSCLHDTIDYLDLEFIDTIPAEPDFALYDFEIKEFKAQVEKVLNALKPKQKDIISKFFGLKDGKILSANKIKDFYGVSYQNICMIKNNIIKKHLKHNPILLDLWHSYIIKD